MIQGVIFVSFKQTHLPYSASCMSHQGACEEYYAVITKSATARYMKFYKIDCEPDFDVEVSSGSVV